MNEERFTGKAEVYGKFRPSYPNEFIEYLYNDIGLKSDSKIADIGAGTGIFSEILIKKGSHVYLVEPNSDMFGEAKKNLAEYKNCSYINASAENTTLPDNSMDFLTSAQAFHWFDREKFKNECRRILKPGGKVILAWNSRVENDGLVMENDMINRKYCMAYKGFSAGQNMVDSAEYKAFFKAVEYKEFENNLYFDKAGFVGRNLSSSYAPAPTSENYSLYINELQILFEKFQQNNRVMMSNITVSYVGAV